MAFAAEPAAPLSDAALDACLAPWETARGLVIAVSGGPDSTALMGAAARLAGRPPTLVVTVDHGLRDGSAAEAWGVREAAAALGLPHRIMRWEGAKPRSGLQAAARAARYALLAEAAREADASHVLTAHTLDDQAETVLMRLARGSDVGGLAGMRRETPLGGLVLARPFLGIAKARLVATCRARAWPFVEDPSNADPRFGRARLRALLPALAAEGLSVRRLVALAARAARADVAIEAATDAARADVVEEADGGRALDGAALLALPPAVALRLIGRLVGEVGGPSGQVRLERLERLVLREVRPALEAGDALRRTLGGALVSVTAQRRIRLEAAPPRRARG